MMVYQNRHSSICWWNSLPSHLKDIKSLELLNYGARLILWTNLFHNVILNMVFQFKVDLLCFILC